MTLLFFDTETTGFTLRGQPPSHVRQPHVVQLAAILTNSDGKPLRKMNVIVKPEGYDEIPSQVSRVHGISTERAHKEGIDRKKAFDAFMTLKSVAAKIIAHNFEFDELVMKAMAHRCESKWYPGSFDCTMKMCRSILKIPPTARMKSAGMLMYKSPNLGECYRFFFRKEFKGAHDAMNDVKACASVYFAAQQVIRKRST